MTTEVKHTPGLKAVGDRVHAENGHIIATVWPRQVSNEQEDGESWLAMRDRTKSERDAAQKEAFDRARLFASSPDLLAALQALLPYADQVQDMGPEGYGWKSDPLMKAIADAEAAVLKATGAA